jgi:hypothetical protein
MKNQYMHDLTYRVVSNSTVMLSGKDCIQTSAILSLLNCLQQMNYILKIIAIYYREYHAGMAQYSDGWHTCVSSSLGLH